nr:small cell adhesion glycoprotein [Ovis aries]
MSVAGKADGRTNPGVHQSAAPTPPPRLLPPASAANSASPCALPQLRVPGEHAGEGTAQGGRAGRAGRPHSHRSRRGRAGTETQSGRAWASAGASRLGGSEPVPRTGRPRSAASPAWRGKGGRGGGREPRRSWTRRGPQGVPVSAGPDPHLPTGARSPTAMTGFPTTPPPAEELMATTILQATEALSPEAEASTALIAVVITVVFLTLLSVVILIFFYLYKNKGSYVTYEPADGEPGAVVLMENDSAKGREKEEYFI